MAIGARANRYNFLIAYLVTLGSFTYGYTAALIGSVLGLPSFFSYFNIDEASEGGSRITGATNGVFQGGGAIGCWTISYLADNFGRRVSIQIICVVCIIAGVLQCGAVHIAMFLVGRFVNGVSVAWINCIVPMYQAEISPASQRGLLVGTHGFIICIGYALAGWTGFGTFYETNPNIQWRLCLALQMVSPLLLLIGAFWLPESPRYLIHHGRDAEGLRVLQDLHASPSDPNHISAKEEFLQIQAQIELERHENLGSIISLLRKPNYRKRLLAGFFVLFIAQTTGVLVVNNYQVILYNTLGLYGGLPLLLYACFDTWASVMNFINTLILDRFGRIRILAIGVIGCALSLVLEAAMVAKYAGTDNKVGNGFGVLFIYIFVTFYGGCMDVSTYVYCSEIFPTRVRAQGVGFSVSGLFLTALVFTQAAPTAFNNIGWKYYLVFIFVPLFCVIFLIRYLPETKGLTLEEISGKFGDKVALNIHDMSEEERAALDARLAAAENANEIHKGRVEHYEMEEDIPRSDAPKQAQAQTQTKIAAQEV